MTTLVEKLDALRNSKDDLVEHMTDDQREAADAAYVKMVEAVVPLFIDEKANTVVMDKLAACHAAVQFYSDLLKIVSEHPVDEVNAAILET